MSKIGKKPIKIPEAVQLRMSDGALVVKGPKGELTLKFPDGMKVEIAGQELKVSVAHPENRQERALWGTFHSHFRNMITGVSVGFVRRLEVVGVGYKAAVSGEKLVLNLGYSHPIELPIPKGIEAKVEKNVIILSGIDKQAVGAFAAAIRMQRKPEPYKGKGVKYEGEVIRRKAGKVVKAVGAG